MPQKHCPSCNQTRDAADFSKDTSRKDGLRGRCKLCDRANSKRYVADPAVRAANSERGKRWAQENRERHRLNGRRFRAANPEKSREYDHRWYAKHGTEINRRYRAENRRKISGFSMDKRARQFLENVERIDYAAIVERDRHICYLCGDALNDDGVTLDHVVPLSRGGEHSGENLRVACRPCNSRKGDRLLHELDWYEPIG